MIKSISSYSKSLSIDLSNYLENSKEKKVKVIKQEQAQMQRLKN